jgi:hypothetical protein
MPFLVLDNQDYPVVDPVTGLICQFETRQQAEEFCREQKARRVMQIPALVDK